MDSEIKEMLEKVLLNQSIIFKKISKIEDKLNNKNTFSSDKNYHKELKKERGSLSKEISGDSEMEIG